MNIFYQNEDKGLMIADTGILLGGFKIPLDKIAWWEIRPGRKYDNPRHPEPGWEHIVVVMRPRLLGHFLSIYGLGKWDEHTHELFFMHSLEHAEEEEVKYPVHNILKDAQEQQSEAKNITKALDLMLLSKTR